MKKQIHGKNGDLVPDASAENPMIVSDPKDQPLCEPKIHLQPAQPITIHEGYKANVLINTIPKPQKIIIDRANHLLVISPENGLYSVRIDECQNADIQLILPISQLDQPIGDGIALFRNDLYITTSNSVYKFTYSDGQHSPLKGGQKIITNINPNNPSAAPDIAINPLGYAFIPRSVHALTQDIDASNAIIKRFNLRFIPEEGYDFDKDGVVHAFGTNTRGSLAFDTQARLWGISNFPGSIIREDISEDEEFLDLSHKGIAEELNLYEFSNNNYGFPFCMTEYDLEDLSSESKGAGGQWGHPSFMNSSLSLDDYCQDETNNRRPAVNIEPNSYATGVHFYMGSFCSVGNKETDGTSVGLPCNWTDTPLVANNGVPGKSSGHNVIRLKFDDLGHKPRWDKKPVVLLEQTKPCSDDTCFSPYGLTTDSFGRLYISSDKTNEVYLFYRVYDRTAAQKVTDELKEEEEEEEDEEDDDEERKRIKSQQRKEAEHVDEQQQTDI
ncbi:hypothetical protein K501DRAFT_289786 [Backusella circina FSU 941]|nr:hypothetical protein K501DRAFT_289786 [Backusella circina FSU 941]